MTLRRQVENLIAYSDDPRSSEFLYELEALKICARTERGPSVILTLEEVSRIIASRSSRGGQTAYIVYEPYFAHITAALNRLLEDKQNSFAPRGQGQAMTDDERRRNDGWHLDPPAPGNKRTMKTTAEQRAKLRAHAQATVEKGRGAATSFTGQAILDLLDDLEGEPPGPKSVGGVIAAEYFRQFPAWQEGASPGLLAKTIDAYLSALPISSAIMAAKALKNSRHKLSLYRARSGEYMGGVEYTALIKEIDDALAALCAPGSTDLSK